MKKNFFVLFCFSFFAFCFLPLITFAQQPALPDMVKMMQSPMTQRMIKNSGKTSFLHMWNGESTIVLAADLFNDPEVRKVFDVSDDQYQQIQGISSNQPSVLLKNPEFLRVYTELGSLMGKHLEEHPGDIAMENADDELQNQFVDLTGKMGVLSMTIMSDGIDALLTPEQKQKIAETQLASMGEMPIFSPSMFEILDLTDDQKRQMEEIKKSLEPEFEKHVEDLMDVQLTLSQKLFSEMEKQGVTLDPANPSEIAQKIEADAKQLAAKDSEFKKKSDEIQKQSMQFSEKFKVRMFDVLTDEQWNRLVNLTDNPPEFVKVFRKKLKEQRGEQEKTAAWQPGPGSWKPGDAIPEMYRQERKERQSRRPFPVQGE